MNDSNPQKNQALDYLALQTYVNELITQRKPQIPTDEMPAYKESLMRQVLEAVNARLVGLLSDEKQGELEKILDKSASQEELNAFFEQNVPDLSAQIALSLNEFKEGYLIDLSKLPPLPVMPVKK